MEEKQLHSGLSSSKLEQTATCFRTTLVFGARAGKGNIGKELAFTQYTMCRRVMKEIHMTMAVIIYDNI